MADPLVTLTTDFGTSSPYVAAMKGVILDINPHARIIDLGHEVPPQDVLHGAFFLAGAVPYFPAAALHVVVVDPGVGTARRLLYCELGAHRLLAPDNGVLSLLAQTAKLGQAIHLTESRYWRAAVSATFHGRDILAPVAGHLSLGLDPAMLGPPIQHLIGLPIDLPVIHANTIQGKVLFVDAFGNLLTNIPENLLSGRQPRVEAPRGASARWVRTYGEARPGELVALASSQGLVEVALVQGSAARHLGVGFGAPVVLRF